MKVNSLIQRIFACLSVMMLLLASVASMAAEPQNASFETKRDYILGAGDMVRIGVYGSPDLITEARLSAAGSINFALIGEVVLGGLSPQSAEKKLADLLEKGGFVKKAQVNLVVLQYQSQFISVLGDVYKPGKYSLDRPSTLSDVLAMAGGTSVALSGPKLSRWMGRSGVEYSAQTRSTYCQYSSARSTGKPSEYGSE